MTLRGRGYAIFLFFYMGGEANLTFLIRQGGGGRLLIYGRLKIFTNREGNIINLLFLLHFVRKNLKWHIRGVVEKSININKMGESLYFREDGWEVGLWVKGLIDQILTLNWNFERFTCFFFFSNFRKISPQILSIYYVSKGGVGRIWIC